MKKLIIIGAGGFSKAIIDSLDSDIKLIGFVDSFKTGSHFGYPILGNSLDEIANIHEYYYFIGIGNPEDRKNFYNYIKSLNLNLISIIDKTSIVSKYSKIGEGVYIGKQTIVNADVVIEDNVVLNTRSLIEHGNYISKHTNISTNVVLNGDVKVGECTFVGSSSVSNGQLVIGDNTTIGSGSVIIKNVDSNVVIAGCPAKLIRRKDNE